MMEEPIQFGEGGRLFGILTFPERQNGGDHDLPVFVFLNAGLLHRVGPFELYVRLARNLAEIGFSSMRVDLAGKGDSPPRTNMTTSQSVAEDYRDIVNILESRIGSSRFVLAGLCSGADDAIRCAGTDERIIGMLLLDPVWSPDDRFSIREVIQKYTNLARYELWLKRRLNLLSYLPGEADISSFVMDYLALRDLPTQEQLQSAFQSISERKGRVLSVFTSYALPYYNRLGQMEQSLKIKDYQEYCTELFWPQMEHTYILELHRRRLIKQCTSWAIGFADDYVEKSP